jgi:hypothetical protein
LIGQSYKVFCINKKIFYILQKNLQLCGMNKLVDFKDGFESFYKYVESRLKPDGRWDSGRIPNELKQALYSVQGKGRDNLGPARAQRLFDKYAPGRYRVILAVEEIEQVPEKAKE